MLSNLSAFFEENDIEQKTMNRTILSVKEHFKILEEEISRYFPNLPDTPFALARSPFTIKVEDVPENAQEEFIELITSDEAKTDFSSKNLFIFHHMKTGTPTDTNVMPTSDNIATTSHHIPSLVLAVTHSIE